MEAAYAAATSTSASRKQALFETLVERYERWNAAEPGQGHGALLADFKAKLEALDS